MGMEWLYIFALFGYFATFGFLLFNLTKGKNLEHNDLKLSTITFVFSILLYIILTIYTMWNVTNYYWLASMHTLTSALFVLNFFFFLFIVFLYFVNNSTGRA